MKVDGVKAVSLAIIIAILVSFSLSYATLSTNRPLDDTDILAKRFLADKQDNTKPSIVIIGSSHVGRYNTTYIDDYLLSHGKDVNVYNLGIIRDLPTLRLQRINDVIALKPALVIYGISFRDLQRDETQNQPLPDPRDGFSWMLSETVDPSVQEAFESPKLVTLGLLEGKKNAEPVLGSLNTPFYNQSTPHTLNIKDQKALESQYNELYTSYRGGGNPYTNKQIIALEKIIDKLKSNNIQVVLVTNPHSRVYLNHISDKDKKAFESAVSNVAQKHGLDVYFLHEEYADLNIFTDPDHIAVRPQSNIVFERIAEIMRNRL